MNLLFTIFSQFTLKKSNKTFLSMFRILEYFINKKYKHLLFVDLKKTFQQLKIL